MSADQATDFASFDPSCIAFAATFCSSAIPLTSSPPKKHSNRDRHREATRRAQLRTARVACRSPSSTNRPPVPSKPTRSSRPRSKASRRRRKCPRSPRRRRCSRRWRRSTRSRRGQRSGSDGCSCRTAYGQAMMWRKGFGAEETTAAFARARSSRPATRTAGAVRGRLRLNGPAAYMRGELRSARDARGELSCATSRRDRIARGRRRRSRAWGSTCWFSRRFPEARTTSNGRSPLFQPGRDDDLAFRFGLDPGIAAWSILASRTWHLGEVDRARESDREAIAARDANLTPCSDAGESATAFRPVIRCAWRPAARRAAELCSNLGCASTAWPYLARRRRYLAVGRAVGSATPGDGLDGPSPGPGRCANRGVSVRRAIQDPLAELEAQAQASRPRPRAHRRSADDVANRHRTSLRLEAYLHRLRGDILLKRDPPNPAPAEEAFLTAIAVAKRAGRAQLRPARRAVARQALPIDRPPRRSPRRPRARARRLFADTGNARDRRGAGAARGAVGDRGGQDRRRAT